jgi:hypothetical protein
MDDTVEVFERSDDTGNSKTCQMPDANLIMVILVINKKTGEVAFLFLYGTLRIAGRTGREFLCQQANVFGTAHWTARCYWSNHQGQVR